MKKISILGAGGHGKVVGDTAKACGYTPEFYDQDYPQKTTLGPWPIVGAMPKGKNLFLAIGQNATRARLWGDLQTINSPNLIHPAATVSDYITLGQGNLIVAGAVINIDTRLGNGVICNTSCSVDHDCVLEDFVHISPGAHLAGGVHVGVRSWIGIGAVVREGVHIGADARIAAGAVVVDDVADGATVMGVPARRK